MALFVVEGLALDGSSVTVSFGKLSCDVIKAEYGDELETEMQGNMGSQNKDYQTPGTIKVDRAKISIMELFYQQHFFPALPRRGFGNITMPIVLTYQHPAAGSDSDLLYSARYLKAAQSTENSSKGLIRELEFQPTRVYYGNARKLRTADHGAGFVGRNGFT